MLKYIKQTIFACLISSPLASAAESELISSGLGSHSFGCAWDESLSIDEALELALCANPRLAQASGEIEIQRHKLAAAKSSYLPTISLDSAAYEDDSISAASTSWDSTLNLSWLLLDFGGRKSTVDENGNLLLAAVFTESSAALALVSEVSQDYFSVAAAKGVIDYSLDNEAATKESFYAAQAKYNAGVGTRADFLQAKTAHSEAVLDSIRARGNYQKALTQLAYTMGVDPHSDIAIDSLDETVSDELSKTLELHMQNAAAKHPSILSAKARLDASRDRFKAVTSEGNPSLSFVSSYSDKRYSTESVGVLNSTVAGLKMTFPLFEGFRHTARVAEAQENIRLQESLVEQAKLDVASSMWLNYSDVKAEIESIRAAKDLVSAAQESSGVAKGRYRTGVGSIIELLSAQTALANANLQYVQSLARWRAARIRLAASVGVFVRNDKVTPL